MRTKFGLCVLCFLVGMIMGFIVGDRNFMSRPLDKPSMILGFQPVMKGSPEHLVKAAQAELARLGLYYGLVDANCGKGTALGICELLVKIEEPEK